MFIYFHESYFYLVMFRDVPECSMFLVLLTPLSTPSTSQSTPCWNWNRKSRFNALSTCEWQLYPQGSLGATLIGPSTRTCFWVGKIGANQVWKFLRPAPYEIRRRTFLKVYHHSRTGIFLIFLQFLYQNQTFKIYHGNENWNVLPYSTTKMPLSTLIEKNKFSHAYIASRSSRSLHGVTTQVKPQVAQARNMSIGDKRHCCVTSKYKDLYGKKIYRFCNLRKWKDFNKKQLTLLKMCVTWSKGRFMAVLWFLCKPFSLPWTTQERLKHTF